MRESNQYIIMGFNISDKIHKTPTTKALVLFIRVILVSNFAFGYSLLTVNY